MRDKVWFHSTVRHTGAWNYVNMFFNRNAGNPTAWTYEADTSRPAASTETTWRHANARITWQATPKNKLAVMYDQSQECACPRTLTAESAPESRLSENLGPKRMVSGDWTAPVTSRLLLEASLLKHDEYAHDEFVTRPAESNLVSVTEQSNNLSYRATSGGTVTWNRTFQYRLAMSYITGAHAFKVGFNSGMGSQNQRRLDYDAPMSFRFNNGVPNQLTLRATPFRTITNIDGDHGLFAQDRWTLHRLTLTLGLRYDYFHDSFPETTIGPGQYAPNRNIVLAETDGVRWHDIQPRSGLVFDVFGTGKTALKISLNKYLAAQAAQGTFAHLMAPVSRLVNSTTRSWQDGNRNFVPDCDLVNPLANGECAAMANPNFGTVVPGQTYDPDTLHGWGKRDTNWEFSTGVQHELVPRVSVDLSYFRRSFGNFIVTDNRAVEASDYDRFNIPAPADSRLPGGGGYLVSGLYDIKPNKFSVPVDNYLTFADNYGEQMRRWTGVDVTINARPRAGVLLGGGTSTGRTVTDNCEILAKLPEVSPLGGAYCHTADAFLTQVKFFGMYTVPRIDVQLTATLQSLPGPQILANYNAPNAVVAPSLGRTLAGGASNVTVNLVEPGTMYGERLNQLDLRFGKILTFGRTRATANFDLYNALNANPVLTQSNAFATWQRPQKILNARLAKVVVQLDF